MSKQKKKQKIENKEPFFQEVFSTTKKELKKKYLRTLVLDLLFLVCFLGVVLVSATIFYGFFSNLNEILPTAIRSVSAIVKNPKEAANYSDELEMVKERLNIFIFGVAATLIVTVLLVLASYTYFQLKIFETLEEKRIKKYWRFFVTNGLLFLLFFLSLPVLIFIIKPFNVIITGIFFVLFVLFVNNVYFSFAKNKKIFASIKAAFALFKLKNTVTFIIICAAFITVLRVLALHQNSFVFSMLIFQILYWPFGRIVIYSSNEAIIKN